MRKIRLLLILGFLVIILPYLGFPYAIKNILISLSGFGVVYLSYILFSQNKRILNEKPTFENFSENHDFIENKDEDISQ